MRHVASASSPAATSRRRCWRASSRSTPRSWCSTSRRTAWTSRRSRMVRERIRELAGRGRGGDRHLHGPRRAARPVATASRSCSRGASRASWTTGRAPSTRIGELIVGAQSRSDASRRDRRPSAAPREAPWRRQPARAAARRGLSIRRPSARSSSRSLACGVILLRASAATRSRSTGHRHSAACCGRAACRTRITRMAPILLIGAGLIVAFRASLWNLGARRPVPARRRHRRRASARSILGAMPPADRLGRPAWSWRWPSAAAWTIIPALLKALLRHERDHHHADDVVHRRQPREPPRQGTVQGQGDRARRPTSSRTTPCSWDLPGTRIHVGVIVALVVVLDRPLGADADLVRHCACDVLGANPRAAVHLGINVPRLIVVAFALSGALIGLAAAVDILGHLRLHARRLEPGLRPQGVPARLPGAAQRAGRSSRSRRSSASSRSAASTRRGRRACPSDFLLLLVGLILLFMVVTQYFTRQAGARRAHPAGAPRTRGERHGCPTF